MGILMKIAISYICIFSLVEFGCGIDRRVLDEILGQGSPHVTPSAPINVNLTIDFLCFLFNSDTRQLQSIVEERYAWQDKRLSWDGDVNRLQLMRGAFVFTTSSSLIWTPDVKLYNRIRLSEKDESVLARIYSDGMVVWFMVAVHHTLCSKEDFEVVEEDRMLYVARCRLKFGPWTHFKNEMTLTSLGESFHNQKHYDQNCAKVVSMTSAVMETYSSAMIYYDFDIVVREVAREIEEPPPEPDENPDEVSVTEALTAEVSGGQRSGSSPMMMMMMICLMYRLY